MKHEYAAVLFDNDKEYLLIENHTYCEFIVKGELKKGKLTHIDSFEKGEIGLESDTFSYFDPKDIEEVITVKRIK